MGKYELILGGEGVEFVGSGDKRLAGEVRDLLGDGGIEALRCVQTGADSGSAESQLI